MPVYQNAETSGANSIRRASSDWPNSASGNWTIMIWARLMVAPSNGKYHTAWSFDNGGSTDYVYVEPDAGSSPYNSMTLWIPGQTNTTIGTLQQDVWQNWCVTKTGLDYATFYKSANVHAPLLAGGTRTSSQDEPGIGANLRAGNTWFTGGGDTFRGALCCFKIWSRALTSAQIDIETKFIEPQFLLDLYAAYPLMTWPQPEALPRYNRRRELTYPSGSTVYEPIGLPPPGLLWRPEPEPILVFSVSSAQTVTPDPATSTWTALDPTIAVGGVTVTPTEASSTWTANDPTIVADVTAAPAEAASTWTANDPTVVPGGATAAPAEATSTWSANDPTIAVGGVTVTPTEASSTWSANDPTIAAAVTISPTEATSTWTALDPSAFTDAGGQVANPAEAISTWSANDPTIVVGGVTVTPTEATSTWSANDPTVLPGGVTASPAEATSTWSANDPTVVAAVTITPTEAVSTWSANDPTVTPGGTTVTPAEAISTWSAIDPVVVLEDSIFVVPQTSTMTWSALDPAIIFGPKLSGLLENEPTTKYRRAQQPASRASDLVQNQRSEDGMR